MFLVLHLNSRLQPKHRFELEDALTESFESNDNVGKITGGGTAMFPSGEIESCDIEIEFSNRSEDFEWLLNLLDNIGIPKGSVVKTGGKDFSVGSLEGLGLYLNGCDLPQEIYEICDVNELIGQLENSLGETGRLFSWMELNDFTALYFYGTIFDEMNDKIKPVISSHPLCQKCRVERIA